MIGPVEVFRQNNISNVVPGGRVEEQAAEDGLLRLDGMWRQRSIAQCQAGIATRFGRAGHGERRLFFSDDRHCRRHVDIGVQMQDDTVIADCPQGAVRQSNLASLDRHARFAPDGGVVTMAEFEVGRLTAVGAGS